MRSIRIRETQNSGASTARYSPNSAAAAVALLMPGFSIDTARITITKNAALAAGCCLPWPGITNNRPKLTPKTPVRKMTRKGASVEDSRANWQMISRPTKYASPRLGLG